jgi:hypothetical protein
VGGPPSPAAQVAWHSEQAVRVPAEPAAPRGRETHPSQSSGGGGRCERSSSVGIGVAASRSPVRRRTASTGLSGWVWPGPGRAGRATIAAAAARRRARLASSDAGVRRDGIVEHGAQASSSPCEADPLGLEVRAEHLDALEHRRGDARARGSRPRAGRGWRRRRAGRPPRRGRSSRRRACEPSATIARPPPWPPGPQRRQCAGRAPTCGAGSRRRPCARAPAASSSAIRARRRCGDRVAETVLELPTAVPTPGEEGVDFVPVVGTSALGELDVAEELWGQVHAAMAMLSSVRRMAGSADECPDDLDAEQHDDRRQIETHPAEPNRRQPPRTGARTGSVSA